MTKQSTVLSDLRAFRRAAGLNQSQFWSLFGVTQSGGSRYESDSETRRGMPNSLAYLLILCEQGKIGPDDLAAAREIAMATLSEV